MKLRQKMTEKTSVKMAIDFARLARSIKSERKCRMSENSDILRKNENFLPKNLAERWIDSIFARFLMTIRFNGRFLGGWKKGVLWDRND